MFLKWRRTPSEFDQLAITSDGHNFSHPTELGDEDALAFCRGPSEDAWEECVSFLRSQCTEKNIYTLEISVLLLSPNPLEILYPFSVIHCQDASLSQLSVFPQYLTPIQRLLMS